MPNQPTKHETIPFPTLPHSGLCDAGVVTFARQDDGYFRPIVEQCTCAAGLLRLVGGGW